MGQFYHERPNPQDASDQEPHAILTRFWTERECFAEFDRSEEKRDFCMPVLRKLSLLFVVCLALPGCSGGSSDPASSTRLTLDEVGAYGLEVLECATLPPGGDPALVEIETTGADDGLSVEIFMPENYTGLSLELGFDPESLALDGMHRGDFLPTEMPCLLLHVADGRLALSAASVRGDRARPVYGFTLRKSVSFMPPCICSLT